MGVLSVKGAKPLKYCKSDKIQFISRSTALSFHDGF